MNCTVIGNSGIFSTLVRAEVTENSVDADHGAVLLRISRELACFVHTAVTCSGIKQQCKWNGKERTILKKKIMW